MRQGNSIMLSTINIKGGNSVCPLCAIPHRILFLLSCSTQSGGGGAYPDSHVSFPSTSFPFSYPSSDFFSITVILLCCAFKVMRDISCHRCMQKLRTYRTSSYRLVS